MGRGAVAVLRAAVRRVPLAILAIAGVIALACAIVLACRYYQTRASGLARREPPQQLAAAGDATPRGRFEATVSYTCMASPTGGATSTITWDDSWFTGDTTRYNHELARAAAVLSALAYAESNYYQASYDCPPYMEDALAALGFDEVATDSYRYRSEIVDQVLNVFIQEEDSVAYTIARKRVDGGDGRARSLILVSVRGSYGAEWVSNLYVGEQGGARAHEELAARAREALADEAERVLEYGDATVSADGSVPGPDGAAAEGSGREPADSEARERAVAAALAERGDHTGYTDASAEIIEAVRPWIAGSHRRGEEVTLLVVGHSRGGAIANIVAAQADDELTGEAAGALGLAAGDAVACYTFAAPATTLGGQAHAERYTNIYNVVNPSDIVPYLPLASWGYARYGEDLYLPALDDAGFESAYWEMNELFERAVGAPCPYDPADVHTVRDVVGAVSEQVASADAFLTPRGVASVISTCATRMDPIRILYGHYPSTYIAWMQALDEDDLRR